MRFKNLTIILTLTCLSLVAFAGLVLLPISNGICEWTGGDHNKSYNISSVDIDHAKGGWDDWSEDTRKGRGWFLNASLNASGASASASVSPSIYGVSQVTGKPEPFTNKTTYGGTATVNASISWASISVCSDCGDWHAWVPHTDSNAGKQRSMWAKVVEKTVRYLQMNGYEIDKTTGRAQG